MKNTRKNTTPIQVTLASLARNYIENMISYQVLVHESYSRTFQEKSKITEKMKSKSTAVVSASRSIDLCMVPKSVTF